MKKFINLNFLLIIFLTANSAFAEYDGLYLLNSNTSGLKHILVASETNGTVSTIDYSSGEKKELASTKIEQKVHGACENKKNIILALGSSIKNQSAPIKIIALDNKLENKNLILKKITGRNQVTHLECLNNKIYLNYFTDTYNSELIEIVKNEKDYQEKSIYKKRMAVYVGIADSSNFVVARPYGDKIGENGDTYIVKDNSVKLLDTVRGASAVIYTNLDDDIEREIIVADGWHQNYGKIAEARLTLLDYNKSNNEYEKKVLVNDPMQFRFENISSTSIKGNTYILASGNKNLWFFKIDKTGKVTKKVIAKKSNPKDELKGVFLGVKNDKINIAILNKDLSLLKEQL